MPKQYLSKYSNIINSAIAATNQTVMQQCTFNEVAAFCSDITYSGHDQAVRNN